MASEIPCPSVIIVGGGIAGLTSAIAMRRAGFKVTVYEKYSFSGEIGAAVAFGRQPVNYLQSLGLDLDRVKCCPCTDMQILDGRTLDLLNSHDNSSSYAFFRPDLQQEMRYLAEQVDSTGQPCRLVEFAAVSRIDPEKGIVYFEDGSQDAADLIIAADGVHSKAMDLVLGVACPAKPSDTTATRIAVPVAKLKENPFARIMASVPGRTTFSVRPGGGAYLLGYWCHGFEYFNIVLYRYGVEDVSAIAMDETRGETTREDIRVAMNQFHPDLGTVCEHLLDVLPLWRLHTRDPVSRYTRGRLVVIGDAAHAMLSVRAMPSNSLLRVIADRGIRLGSQHFGQGANSAILDAAALGTLFADMTVVSAKEISWRLRLYDQIRSPRVSATQIWSEAPVFEQKWQKIDEIKKILPETELPQDVEHLLMWLQEYDVVQDCREKLQEQIGKPGDNCATGLGKFK
ncbi:putative salicylate [Mycena sanguinolenta]|uniref:Putative salicylate n=1 Tax=Mycena sanguinolenta TaxID=230812 RepID=A0A8H6ZFI0_9AGAR|nr:putative salicylate [Mycena sanguinolenta]